MKNFTQNINTYINPLEVHDETRHTELLNTLELYIKNNCSKTETEKQLFIHKNTLRARLATINKVLNCDVDSIEDLF
jgi:PucR family transcriptional regulator, purine catabolism regulatory protein